MDQSKGMLGTFAPQRDPYEHLLEEETTPSGVLARGIYSAKLKVVSSVLTNYFSFMTDLPIPVFQPNACFTSF